MERLHTIGHPEGSQPGQARESKRSEAGQSRRADDPDRDFRTNLSDMAPLSPLEMEIMDLVWDLKECSSAEVIAAYGKVRHLADTTIRTVLTNIRKKGYLELVPSIERGHRFRPTLNREQVARQTLNTLVKRLFKGRAREAISLLLADDLMTERDLKEIRRLVERRQDAVSGHS